MITIARESQIVIRDRATKALERVMNTMGRTIEASERLNQSVMDTDSTLDRLDGSGIADVPPMIKQAERAQDQFNDEIHESINLMGMLKTAAAAIGIGKIVKSAIEQSDQYATTRARIDLMNDGLRTTTEVQDLIFRSAQNARSEYTSMADMVGRLGLLAGEAFSSTAETVAFAELIQKQFTIAGTSASEAAGATTQLVQALGSGVLRGDELNSIFEQAPTIIQSIADYLDVPIGQIRELASEGELTADIVKNAMFASVDDINAKFESMPKTWANLGTSLRNHMQKAFEPLSQLLSDLANSVAVQEMINGIIGALYVLGNVATRVLTMLGGFANFVASNMNVIAPILAGIASILLVVHARTMAVWVWTRAVAVAQWAWNGAVAAYNAIMSMNPFAITLVAIIAIVALLYAGVGAWNNFANASVSATGIIMGALAWLGAGIVNIISGIINIFIVFAQLIVNAFQIAVMTIAYVLFGLITVVFAVVDVIIQIFLRGIELIVTLWNLGVFAIHMIMYGLIVVILGIFDAIINAVFWVVEIFVNAWNNGVFAVQMAFYKMAEGIASVMNAVASGAVGVVNAALGMISDLVNTAVSGLNAMINAANNIPGVNIGTIGTVDFRIDSSGIGDFSFDMEMPTMPERWTADRSSMASDFINSNPLPTMNETPNLGAGTNLASDLMDWGANNLAPSNLAQFETLDWMNMAEAFQDGQRMGVSFEEGVSNFLDGIGDMFTPETGEGMSDLADILENLPEPAGGGDGGGGNPTGGKLDSVGEIEDEIDISDEVIKYMKDIANLRYQQNFITLTPEIVNNNSFVEPADQEDAINKFNNDIAEALYSATDGFYDE